LISLYLSDSGEFSLVGADHPGIVHRVTTALAKAGLSIDRLETDQEIAPYGGSVLFKMRGVAIALSPLPKHFDLRQVKADLEELGDSLNCDITLEDTVDESVQGSFYAG
jgi:glycine cleavage system transcriptional repressor